MKNSFFRIVPPLFLGIAAVVLFTIFVLVPVAAVQAAQAPPQIVSYQGRLTDGSGNLLGGTGTTYYFKFSIWSTSATTTGTQLWPSSLTSTAATVRQGVFTVNIGDTANGYPTALDLNFATNNSLYLQVEVSSNNSSFETLSPRQQLTSALFAQVSGAVVGTTTASAFGTTTPVANSFVTIAATSTGSIPLSLIAVTNQIANLFQIQNSSGINLFSVGATGNVSMTNATSTTSFATIASSTNLFASNATSTSFFATTASSTNLFTSNLSVGSLSGFLKATAGAVTTALVNLASDVTGVLTVSNGGTGWATIATGAIPYGNGSSAVSTTTQGTGGKILAWSGGFPTWVGTTTFSSGLTYNNGNVTNSGVLSLGPAGSLLTGSLIIATSSSAFNGLTASTTITGNGTTLTFTNSLAGLLGVAGGGTGSTTLTGLLKGNSTGGVLTALSGTDYLTGSGSSGNCVKWGPGNTLSDFGIGCGGSGGTGITDIGPIGQTQNGTVIIFATTTSNFSGLTTGITITGAGNTITFAPAITGTLSVSGGGTGTTTAPVGQLLYGGSNGVYQSVATSTLSGNDGLTLSAGNGFLVGGSNATIGLASIAANSVLANISGSPGTPTALATSSLFQNSSATINGLLSNTDWTTFNAKQATISATWPVILTGAALSFGGLSTSTAAVAGNIPYFSGVNTFANVATSTLSGNDGLTLSAGNGFLVGGSNATIGLATINAGVLGAQTNGSVPTSQATSTLYGTGTGGQVLTWSGGVPTWSATTTFATTTDNGGWGFTGQGTQTLNIPTASATNLLGLLSNTDWTTFNAKQATISATWPVILTGAALSFGGLSTSTAAVAGNIPYFSGANTFANIATTSATINNGLTGTLTTLGASQTIGLATMNAGVLGAQTNGSVPTSQATSTLYGTGLGGQVLTWSSGVPSWIATSTFSIGGNAATATILQTTRTINGVSFNGSADITITAASSTLLANTNTWSGTNTFNTAPSFSTALAASSGGTGSTTSFYGGLFYSDGTNHRQASTTALLQWDPTTQIFTTLNASTTRFSSLNGASFGATATSSFSSAGVLSLASALGVGSGGTGVGSFTANSLFYSNSTGTALAFAATSSLNIGGTAANVTGTVAIANGGTGTTTAPVSQLLYGGTGGIYQSVATSTLAGNNGLTLSAGTGFLIGGTNATIGLASIAANSVLANISGSSGTPTALATSSLFQNSSATITGLLSNTDWSTFNSKQATISATWPVILTGAALSFGGLSTSTAAVAGNIPYFSGANTFANVATTSATINNGLTGTLTTLGPSQTIGLATMNAGVLGAQTNGSVPTSQATSTLYGTGLGGQVLTWSGGVPSWIATSTFSIGGNAGTATALQTARTINGVSFNGTANIVVASTTLLGDTNTWSGTNTFNTAPSFSTALAASSGGTGSTTSFYGGLFYSDGTNHRQASTTALLQWDPTTQIFTTLNASTTRFSSLNGASFGATATSSFSSAGVLTLASALGVGSGGTGVSSFTGASLLYSNAAGTALAYAATSSLNIGGTAANVTGTVAVANGGTGTTTAPVSQLLYGGTGGIYQSVATTSASCSGNTSCSAFVVIGTSPITISSTGGGSAAVSTSTNEVAGNLPYWTTTSGSPAKLGSIATSTFTVSGPFIVPSTLGTLVGGSNTTITYTGLATTTQPSSSNLLVSNGTSGVYGLATTSASCSSGLSCTAFDVLKNGGAITLDLTSANTFSGIQRFYGSASSTILSAHQAFFGATATSSFSSAGVLTLASALGVGSGGTGVSSFTANSLLYANSAGTALAFAATSSLNIGGTSANVTGTVAIANGGTGTTTAPVSQLLYGGTGGVYQSVATTSETCSSGITCTSHAVLTGGGAITLDLTSVNTFTGIQRFYGSASSTLLSAHQAFFGATATSSFSSAGVLTLASALGVGSGGTGVSSFTGASLLYSNAAGTALAYAATSSLNIGGTAANVTGTVAVGNGGTGTTTAPVSQLLYGGSGGIYQSVATSTLAVSTGLTVSGTLGSQIGGTNSTISFASIAANSLWANGTSASAVPTVIATSSLYGIGVGGQVLQWSNTANGLVLAATSSSSGGYATIQDETTPLTQRTALNFTGTGVSCADNAGTSATDCTINAGAATAAGATGNIQFNTSNALDAVAGFTFNKTNSFLGIGSSTPYATLSASSTSAVIATAVFDQRGTGGLLTLQAGGLDKFTVANNGNVGIGTSTPQWALTIASSTAPQLSLTDGSNTSPPWTFRSINGNFYLGTSSPSTFATSSIPTLSIMNSGISGILGVGSSTPWGKFSIEMGPTHPAFVVSNQGSSTPSFFIGGVNQNGYVGVGTSSPFAEFSIHAASTTNAATLFAIGSTSNNGAFTSLLTVANSGNTAFIVGNNNDNAFTIATSSANALTSPIFSISTRSSPVGLVGFGTSTPWGKLSVEMGTLNPSFVISNQGSSTPSFFIGGVNQNGFVGIGTSSPSQYTNFIVATTSANPTGPTGYGAAFSIQSHMSTTTIQFFGATSTLLNSGAGNISASSAVANNVIVGSGKVTASMSIINGGLCVDNDGWCTASTTGRITARASQVGGADLAEMYSSSDNLAAGEIVSATAASSVVRATRGTVGTILGVVSTAPGYIMGLPTDKDEFTYTGSYPIALAGRVPVIVNTEAGNISAGDPITISSVAGQGKLATSTDRIIGYALDPFTGPGAGTVTVFISKNNYIADSQFFISDSNNRVGIGTTSPSKRLSVQGDGLFSGDISVANLTATGTAAINTLSLSNALSIANGGTGLSSFTANSLLYSNSAGTALAFAATSTLSIGGNAASATVLETARTIAGVSFNGSANISISSTGLSDTANIAYLNAANVFTNTGNNTFAGRIGIGTTSPFALLSISNSVSTPAKTMLFAIASTTLGTATSTLFSVDNTGLTTIGNPSGTGDANFQFANDTNAWSMGYYSVDKTFRIASSTNLTASVYFQIGKSGTTTLNSGIGSVSGTDQSLCIDGTTFEITRQAGDSCAASAARYKHDITSLQIDGLAMLGQFNPVSFVYNGDISSTIRWGFIADEMASTSPELASFNADGSVQTINNIAITAVLAKAIQELNLNIADIASTTASSTPSSRSFVTSFFSNLFGRITAWLADTGNGIVKLFAKEVHTDKLCVSDSSGGETCITKAQLDALLSGGAPALVPAPTPASAPEPSPISEPAPEPEPISTTTPTMVNASEPTPAEPVLEPVSETPHPPDTASTTP